MWTTMLAATFFAIAMSGKGAEGQYGCLEQQNGTA
jgi:hypothetical protein